MDTWGLSRHWEEDSLKGVFVSGTGIYTFWLLSDPCRKTGVPVKKTKKHQEYINTDEYRSCALPNFGL